MVGYGDLPVLDKDLQGIKEIQKFLVLLLL
jgi:hypothetical protein